METDCEVLLTYLLTYLLTPWNRVHIEKLTFSQQVKKFPAFYGTQKFIAASTIARHLSLSFVRSIQSMPTSHFLKSHLNIILLSTPGSFKFSLSLGSTGAGWENGLQYGGYLRIYWISSRGQLTREGTPSWGLSEVLKTPRRKDWSCYGTHTCASGMDWLLSAG